MSQSTDSKNVKVSVSAVITFKIVQLRKSIPNFEAKMSSAATLLPCLLCIVLWCFVNTIVISILFSCVFTSSLPHVFGFLGSFHDELGTVNLLEVACIFFPVDSIPLVWKHRFKEGN